MLGAQSVIPPHADVANAVGAVVGRVRLTRECVVSAPSQGQYVVHAGEAPALFTDLGGDTPPPVTNDVEAVAESDVEDDLDDESWEYPEDDEDDW